ncbi:MAG: hypothetical protein LBG65_05000 [Puniceicoccales bacterium]|nr:hypothetical protein [Puniceicoccales bacterium]
MTFGAPFLAALVVCMFSCLGPFSMVDAFGDASVFLNIGEGMHNGKVPYRDLFDHKGPLLYFIHYIGLFFGGRLGVWFMELALMFVTFFFSYRTALLVAGRQPALWGIAAMAATTIGFYQWGDFPEEYGMAFISIAFFLFAGHLLKNEPLTRWKSLAIGACFGAVLLLKPTLFPVWIVFGATIVTLGFIRGKYRDLVFYVVFFFLGTAAVITPFLLYLLLEGAFPDFWEQYVVFNQTYARQGGAIPMKTYLKNFSLFLNRNYIWVMLLAGVGMLVLRFNTRQRPFYIAYVLTGAISLCSISFSPFSFPRYGLVTVPLLVLAWTLLASAALDALGGGPFARRVIPLIAFVGIFNLQIGQFLRWRLIFYPYGANQNYEMHIPLDVVREACAVIRTHAPARSDKITVFGRAASLYYYSGRESVSKYFYQFPIGMNDVNIAKKYEEDVIKGKPKLIVVDKIYESDEILFRKFQLRRDPALGVQQRFLFGRMLPLTDTYFVENGVRQPIPDPENLRKQYRLVWEKPGYVQIYKRNN